MWQIVIKDSNKVSLQTITTDSLGGFKINLPAGKYFLLIVDNWLQQPQGPFVVEANQWTSAKLNHDNGRR